MDNLQKTQEFFNKWSGYHHLINGLDTFRFMAEALQGEIHGKVLDIGNGGVFNYDVECADELVVVDLAEELVRKQDWPPHMTFKWGDATALPVEGNLFDTCLLQHLIHHLAEANFAITRRRVQVSIQETFRVLKPGGKLVILESCLPKLWEVAERMVFPAFRLFLERIHHPMVFQWNWNTLARFVRGAGFIDVGLTRVRLGRWGIQLGRRWPTALSPTRAYKIVAYKPQH